MSSDRKMIALSGQAVVPGAAQRSRVRWSWGCWSGGRGQGDDEAERLELADVVAGLAVLVDAVAVEVGAEVVEAGGGVGEQLPDDHQDRAGDGDQGFELADAPDQAAVALAEEGVGLGGRGGDLAEDALQVRVALAGGATAVLGAGLDGPGCQPGPRHQLPGGGELAHVQPELGDDDLGGLGADAGDLVQTLQRSKRGLGRLRVRADAAGAVAAAPGPGPVPRAPGRRGWHRSAPGSGP